MTTWKAPDAGEVERVYRALVAAFLAEKGLAEEWAWNVEDIDRPQRAGKARALWDAMRLAWAAYARFERRAATARNAARGTPLHVLDDKRRDQAIANVERALTLLRNAKAHLQADVEALGGQENRYSGIGIDLKEQRDRVKRMDALTEHTAIELANLKTFGGTRQIWTRREWETFISESAAALLAAGMRSREVAALLTGQPEDKIDRATLERFRQRVRRRAISEG